MPPYHRPYLRTRDRMIQSIIDIMRNDLILRKAYDEGFDKQKEVKVRFDKFIEDLLVNEMQKRIHSEAFRESNPKKWEEYQQVLKDARHDNNPIINKANLFHDVSNPDSVMAPAPIFVFLKDRYVW